MKLANHIFQRFPLLRIAVVLILGIFVGDAVGESCPQWTGLAASGGFLALYLLFRRCHRLCHGILLLLACFSFGFYLISSDKRRQECSFPAEKVAFDAILASEPAVRGKVVRCELLVVRRDRKPRRIRASILRDTLQNRYQRLHVGDGIHAWALIESPDVSPRQSGFDYQRWLQVHDIVGQTFILHSDWRKAAVSMQTLPVTERAKIRLMKFRQKAVDALRLSGLDGSEQAIVAAMALGDKSALTSEIRETYSISGASHVLALSGLHLGIIYFILSFVFVRLRWVVAGQLLTLPLIWLFTLMVGFSPSVVRAATMLTVYGLVALFGRRSFSLNTLSLAAIVMLVARPLVLWDIGFQLSFMAVLGIIVFYRVFDKGLWVLTDKITAGKVRKVRFVEIFLKWVLGLAAVSLSTQLMTTPLVMHYFGRFSMYFLLTNFVAIPLVTLILYLAAAFFLTVVAESWLGALLLPVKQLLVAWLYRLSSMLNGCLGDIASWPCSSVENIRLGSLQTFLLYVLLAVICAMAVRVKKIHRDYRLTKFR